MNKLEFDSFLEMQDYFKSTQGLKESNKHLSKTILEAIDTRIKTVKVFEITLIEEGVDVEIAVARPEWVKALESSLEVFGKFEMGDEGIDTYLGIKKLKNA